MKLKKLLMVIVVFVMAFVTQAQVVQDQVQESSQLAYSDVIVNEPWAPFAVVNVPAPPQLNIGVSELKDIADLFFKGYEIYLKASADDVINAGDVTLLLGLVMLIPPAFSGATKIPGELDQLTDAQIILLCNVADSYELGAHAQRAKSMFRTIIVLANTFFVFKQTSGEQAYLDDIIRWRDMFLEQKLSYNELASLINERHLVGKMMRAYN